MTYAPTHTRSRGFTLIELLVVIAIIGILAAVILPSLTTSRGKSSNAAIKSTLENARAQAGIYYTEYGTYVGLCEAISPGAVSGVNNFLVSANTLSTMGQPLNITLATAGNWNTVTCHEDGVTWALEAPLITSTEATPIMWCLDGEGAVRETATPLAGDALTCP